MTLALNRPQAIIWTNTGPIHWRMYAGVGGDELINASFRLRLYSISVQITLDIPGSPIDSQWGSWQLCTRSALLLIVPFHNKFSPSGEQSEQRKLAHTL